MGSHADGERLPGVLGEEGEMSAAAVPGLPLVGDKCLIEPDPDHEAAHVGIRLTERQQVLDSGS
jgi:hypothetical protein